MKIIYHFRVKGVGPERVHISGIAGAFENLGHEVSFVSPTNINPLKTGDVTPQKGILRGFLYYLADKVPQVCFEAMEILYNVSAYKKLKKQILLVSPQFIYERYAFFCIVGIYLSKKFKIPLILEVNEVGGFDRVRPQKLVKLAKAFEQFIFANASVIITVSDFLKMQIIQRGGVSDKILVVPNGIDKRLFEKQFNSEKIKQKYHISDQKVIGFVGYLVHWHRLDLLIKVFAKLKNMYPDIKMLFVGDGTLRTELEGLAKSLNVWSDIIITGRVDHSEVPDYLNLFDVAVIPNSNEYRSPIKMFEYMAMGKTIVAPDQPPILDVLTNGETGLIFKNGDEKDLFDKIISALDSIGESNPIGFNAQQLVFDKYLWDKHVENILGFSGIAKTQL